MIKCSKCETEYEGDSCPNCGTQCKEPKNIELSALAINNTVDTQAVAKAFSTILKETVLKYAPLVLFSLWALLLWALYASKVTAAELFDDFSVNLYQALKYQSSEDDLFLDLYPILNALLSFAIISNVYIVALALAHRKGNKLTKMIVDCGGVLLQLAVLICALITRGAVTDFGMNNGSFVALVASFTGAIVALQMVCLLLRTRLRSEAFQNVKNWADSHPADLKGIVLLTVLIIAASIVLALTLA